MLAAVVAGVAMVCVVSAMMSILIVHRMEVLRKVMQDPVQVGVSNYLMTTASVL